MGTKPLELAIALDIERQSYHRLEKNWHTISQGELQVIADTVGVEPSQFWFPPPSVKTPEKVSIDDLLEDVPDTLQILAVNAVRGMIGK